MTHVQTPRLDATKVRCATGALPTRVWAAFLLAFRWMVTTDRFLFTIATLIVGGSFALSYTMDDWHWFQRSGAMLASIGAILSTRPVLRTTIDTMLGRLRVNRARAQDGELASADLAACFVGFWVVGTGTLIWAYGDLLGCLLGSNCL